MYSQTTAQCIMLLGELAGALNTQYALHGTVLVRISVDPAPGSCLSKLDDVHVHAWRLMVACSWLAGSLASYYMYQAAHVVLLLCGWPHASIET